MRNYELVCIIHPDMEEAAFNDAVDKIKGWISDSEGTVDKVDNWGRRKMAYPIQKQMEGQYVLLHVTMQPTATEDLERKLRLLEPVMRHMFVLVD